MDSEIACLFVSDLEIHIHKTGPENLALGDVLLENLMTDGIGAQSLQMGVASSWRKQS